MADPPDPGTEGFVERLAEALVDLAMATDAPSRFLAAPADTAFQALCLAVAAPSAAASRKTLGQLKQHFPEARALAEERLPTRL